MKRSEFLLVVHPKAEGWVVEVHMRDGSDRAWSCGSKYSKDDAADCAYRAASEELQQPIMED